jgi:hypothetical protein
MNRLETALTIFHRYIDKSGLLSCRQLELQQAHKTGKGMYHPVSMKVTEPARADLKSTKSA